ncbi:hypothetical protein JB92DRAFT_3148955 [Gautieria morchelliformis]|nr:hypothetical protein JB92DRAFT_3148955 [Gautieria morchelliformis]
MPPFQHLLHIIRQQLQLPWQNVRLAAAKLPSAPSPECIGGRAVEGSGNTSHTGETTGHTEDALGGDVAKKLAAGNNSSRMNKRKTLDIVELTDSELHANRDLDEFFEEPAAVTGKDGKLHKCRACKFCGTSALADIDKSDDESENIYY